MDRVSMEERRWDDRRLSDAARILMAPQMRSQRLIGNSNPRYRWEQYWKTEEELKAMPKKIRKYYERNNYLIQQYIYIDRLLDSSLPHDLIQEYNQPHHIQRASSRIHIPSTIEESPSNASTPIPISSTPGVNTPTSAGDEPAGSTGTTSKGKLKRTPKNLYKIPDETIPLLKPQNLDEENGGIDTPIVPPYEPEEDTQSGDRIVIFAIYLNMAANTVLLIMKIVVAVMTSSVSVLASLVDAALDFLSTAIVWTTTRLISQKDQYRYPVGRRRLEPVGVLVFSVIMITSFFQVALEGLNRMTSGDHTIIQLTISAIVIMALTVVIKFFCWLWCRLINNSSVQALAQDAMTDVVFNIFSIIFPLSKSRRRNRHESWS
jgi:Cation efflux family